jgi:hypothetical protein
LEEKGDPEILKDGRHEFARDESLRQERGKEDSK